MNNYLYSQAAVAYTVVVGVDFETGESVVKAIVDAEAVVVAVEVDVIGMAVGMVLVLVVETLVLKMTYHLNSMNIDSNVNFDDWEMIWDEQ